MARNFDSVSHSERNIYSVSPGERPIFVREAVQVSEKVIYVCDASASICAWAAW